MGALARPEGAPIADVVVKCAGDIQTTLREARARRGLSLLAVARAAAVPETRVWNLERRGSGLYRMASVGRLLDVVGLELVIRPREGAR